MTAQRVDSGSEDLIDAAEVARILGLAHRNSVSTYRSRYPDFPQGRPSPGGGRTLLWSRDDIDAWHQHFVSRRQGGADGNPRLEDLVAATVRLMLSTGSSDVSIRQIAAEAGVAHSDLYRYATSKDHLRRLAVDRIANDYNAAMPSTFDELQSMAGTLIGRAQRLRPAMAVLAYDLLGEPETPPASRIAIQAVAELVAEHRASSGVQTEVDPAVIAMCVGAIVWGIVLFGERWRGPLGLDEVPLDQVAAVVRAILDA